ncbi:MAG TPA: CAP domain-containing protein [Gemmatimonadaceae bacterium]
MSCAHGRYMRIPHVPAACLCASILIACASLQIPAPAPPAGKGPGTTTASTGSVAADVVAYTNQARARNGLPAFATNSKLMDAARIHAQQMAQFQRADHSITGAQYPTLVTRLQAVGYNYSNAAENVAWNQRDAQSVVNTWMNSSGHRANILDPNLKEIGAAMARSSKGEPYWIQVFGTPR